ncbi:hypothetical protein ABW636_20060 [Aquimarina sp. 2201CG1-2-11]|uniref:hypothetical protein n=1 Tax=Aquimarina discodermiae TaxID=3231043 RepID=UPI003462F234
MIKKNVLLITLLVMINLLHTSCSSNDNDEVDGSGSQVSFEKAQLFDFILSEVDENLVEDISIKQPKMVNGVAQDKGEIRIELAYTTIPKFSLKQVPFNTEDFNIVPAVGEQHILPGKNITYTITPSQKTEVTLQYDVLVTIKEINPEDEKLEISEFQFLSDQNPGLGEDVSSSEIRKYPYGRPYNGTIVMIVPNGTDFSNLAPKIMYEGSSITYKNKTDSDESYKEFTPGTFLDFKYPNEVILKIHNSDRSRYAIYSVLVDVKNPIVFDDTTASIGLVESDFKIYNNVIGFTNYGNYPITSDIFASEINVTETPEEVIQNYFIHVVLKGDGSIHTNQKGRLHVTVSFPSSMTAPGPFRLRNYKVDVIFKIMNRYSEIEKYSDLLTNYFDIYTPSKIELIADIFAGTLR